MRIKPTTALLALLALAAPALAAPPTASAPATGKAMVWKVSTATNTVYVMGTLHLGSKAMYPMPPEVVAAFNACKALAFEANTSKKNQKSADAEEFRKAAMYPKGKSLSTELDKETLAAVKKACEENKVPFAQIDPMRPFMAQAQLSVAAFQSQGFTPVLGVETFFRTLADKRPDMEVIEVEGLRGQAGTIKALTDEQQLLSLKRTLSELDSAKKNVVKVQDLWLAGDLEALDAFIDGDKSKKSDAEKALDAKLTEERNTPMALMVIDLLTNTKKPTFILLGEGHLGGEKGVLALLKEKGYTPVQMTVKRR